VTIVNPIMTALFDALYGLLGLLPPWLSLSVLSVLAGVLALVVMRYCSNQAAIGRVKDGIKADMLALKLFKDELPVVFRAQGRLVLGALRMQYYMLPPMAVMMVPFILAAAQMGLRYQWRALRPDEESVLSVALRRDAPAGAFDITIEAPDGVQVDRRVRKPVKHEVDWIVRGARAGRYTLRLRCGGDSITKQLVVGDDAGRVSPRRPGPGFVDRLLYPAERPFGSGSMVQSVSIAYPPRESRFCGADWWVVWFLVLSIVAALALKPIFRVKF